ncbi:M23 family metallopeptidase [Parerythrobacter jejuensis]|uniref:Peptidoglycan DD-metalloendopeptidase family protein n=1 Tax=Parerythrobacter jejuensis TaxID=795812 RepID=A0A845ARH9_9SPHN|nr:M23 family metallopeptidase [Parerythrobacter jejuensis]MXP32204.1 peptidoglycan DD-metalloendopeptidase family protein [Parerythrobacter jejuensis]
MKFFDRLLTVVITATVTSMFWIVAGGSLIESASSDGQIENTRPSEAAPSPEPEAIAPERAEAVARQSGTPASPLDRDVASQPSERDSANLLVPVLNVRPSDLSDTFSTSEGGGASLHEALDIMAPQGTTVVAAAPGTVEKLFRSGGGGNTIYIRSADGRTIHYYAHLSKYADGLQEGQRVRRGQRIGEVGSTGNANADEPHLHFAILRTTKGAEWWEPANAVNPYPLLTGGR